MGTIALRTVEESCQPADPYTFTVAQISGESGDPKVKLVMPLGGMESGLYRSPVKGDKVLVYTEGTEKYLMGYLPTSDQPFSECTADDGKTDHTADVIKSRGQVFRYQQTGRKADDVLNKAAASEQYSEIGFYHKPTQWKAAGDDKGAYNDFDPANPDVPNIDRINIHSTGDIYENAENHHRTSAKRIEILSLDNPDDKVDPKSFKRGDLHIKAGGDITIEAGKSITLKVGRSTITIYDDTISIKNQLISTLPNPADASISLNAWDGVAVAGQTVGLAADYNWSVSDKFGAGLSGTAGSLRQGGRSIEIAGQQYVAQVAGNVAYGLDYGLKLSAAITGAAETPSAGKKAEFVEHCIFKYVKIVSDIVSVFFKYSPLPGKIDTINRTLPENNGFGPVAPSPPGDMYTIDTYGTTYGKLASVLDLIRNLISTAYKSVMTFSDKYDAKTKDIINTCFLSVDDGIVLALTSIMVNTSAGSVGSAGIYLSGTGNIDIKAMKEKKLYAEASTTGAATAPLTMNWVKLAALGVPITGQLVKLTNQVISDVKNWPKVWTEKDPEKL